MSSKNTIAYVNLRVFGHATEDEDNVLKAVRNILPTDVGESLVFSKSTISGHYGNPITLYEAKLEDKRALLTVLCNLGEGLTVVDKMDLESKWNLHLEKRNLYLRLDKQSAFLGKLKLSSNDPVHLKIHFKNKSPEEIVEICKQTGLLP